MKIYSICGFIYFAESLQEALEQHQKAIEELQKNPDKMNFIKSLYLNGINEND